jgi:iron complex outermembrane receptor protein
LKLVAINDSTIGDEPVSDDDLSGYKFFIPYQTIKHYRFQNISAFNLKNTDKIITNIGYQYNIRDEFGPHMLIHSHEHSHGGHDHSEENENVGELSMHLHTIPYQLRYIKNIDSSQFLSIGSTGMYQKNINKGEELLIPDYDLFDAGIYLFYQKSLKNISFSGGIRWDIRNINSKEMFVDSNDIRIEGSDHHDAILKFSAFNKNYNNFSGTAGMVYSGWKDVLLKFNIARGFRTPNPAELSSNGAHEGTVRYEYGNNKLKQEVSYQADLGFILNKEHILFEVSPFFNYIQNYIFYRRLSSQLGGDSVIVKDGENIWAYKFDQTNDAMIYGGELNIDIHPHPLDFLHFESNFSYLQGKFLNATDSTQYLPFFPPSRWTNGIRLEWNNLSSSIKRFFVNAEAMYVFPQNNYYKAFNTETYTPDYTLINVSAGLGWKYYKNNTMTLIAGVNNLLDEAYMSHLNRLKYVRPNPLTGKGIYNMGRNIFVRLIIDF